VKTRNHVLNSDIDECLINNGGGSQLCVNEPGSYMKCQCKKGFYPTYSEWVLYARDFSIGIDMMEPILDDPTRR
jgi:hypothetical protein